METDTWADFFPSLRHCRVAHGAVADTEHDTLYVTGGSAKVRVLLRGRIGKGKGSIERMIRLLSKYQPRSGNFYFEVSWPR